MDEAKVIEGVTFIAQDETTKGAEPSKEPLDLPPAFVAAQRSAILRLRFPPIAPMRGDHLDAWFGQLNVERISIMGAIADQP